MLRHFFTRDYLFAPSFSGINSLSDIFYTAVALILLIAGIVIWVARNKTKNPLKKELYLKWRRLCLTIGILGAIWVFLRYEGIAVLGVHWVIWALGLIGIIWAAYIVNWYRKVYKVKNVEFEKEQQKKKYI